MLIIGINAHHPDASVAFIRDGELIWAAEEERYSRIKHASGFLVMALPALKKIKSIPRKSTLLQFQKIRVLIF